MSCTCIIKVFIINHSYSKAKAHWNACMVAGKVWGWVVGMVLYVVVGMV